MQEEDDKEDEEEVALTHLYVRVGATACVCIGVCALLFVVCWRGRLRRSDLSKGGQQAVMSQQIVLWKGWWTSSGNAWGRG